MTLNFFLPWPKAELSPNSRCHWAAKAKAAKSARKLAYVTMRQHFPMLRVPDGHLVAIEFVFCPPNLRRYDDDNLAARMKSARDGMADYLGVDDHLFRQTQRLSKAPVPMGQVIVKFEFLPALETAEEPTA